MQKYKSKELAQLVVTIPSLTTFSLQNNLEIDFNSLKGVKFCEASIMTNTLLLNFDPRDVKLNMIDQIFQAYHAL